QEHSRARLAGPKTRVNTAPAAGLPHVHDPILWYSRSDRFRYAHQHAPLDPAYIRSHYGQRDPATGRRYQLVSLIQDGAGPARRFGDRTLAPPRGKHWIWSQDRIDRAFAAGGIRLTRNGRPRLVRYLDEAAG